MKTLKKAIVSIIYFGIILGLNSQNNTQLNDSLMQKSFDELVVFFYSNKNTPDKALNYVNAYFKKALIKRDTMKMLEGKYILSQVKENDSIFLNFCDSLIHLTSKKPSKNFPVCFYLEKNRFFYHKGKFNKALKELTFVNSHLDKHPNDSILHLYYVRLALLKGYFEKTEEAIDLYKKAYHYAEQKKIVNTDDFISTLPNLAANYSQLHQPDSALKYSQLAIVKLKNDSTALGALFLLQGKIFWGKKDHTASLDNYLKSIPYFLNDDDYRVATNTYSKIGVNYDSLHNTEKSLEYHLKADSIFSSHDISSSDIKHSFKFLIEHYKKENDLDKQLIYTNKLLKTEQFDLTEKNKIQHTLTNEFDIPNLLAERKQLIQKLEYRSKRNKFIFLLLLLVILFILGYQIKKKSIYKKRFTALINQTKSTEPSVIIHSSSEDVKSQSILSDEIVKPILQGLTNFEHRKAFLNSSINLQTLASELNTNANYLSKVINQYKNSSFSNYMNKLRIEHAVSRLKKDPLWRKYTIKAIANEVGFKNAESFSKAFYKYTELRPSYFIKELEKVDTN